MNWKGKVKDRETDGLSELRLRKSETAYTVADTETLSPLWFAGLYKNVQHGYVDDLRTSFNLGDAMPFKMIEPDEIELPQTRYQQSEQNRKAKNLLQEFELDYSQALSLDPKTIASSSESIPECGITLTDPLIFQKDSSHDQDSMERHPCPSRTPSRLALVARAIATSYQITKKFGMVSLQETVSKNKEYFENLRKCYDLADVGESNNLERSQSTESLNSYKTQKQTALTSLASLISPPKSGSYSTNLGIQCFTCIHISFNFENTNKWTMDAKY